MSENVPSKQWMTAKEAAQWLEMDVRQFRYYVDSGLFPEGIPRGKRLRVWSREDVLAMVYLEKSQSRFVPKTPDEREGIPEDEPED